MKDKSITETLKKNYCIGCGICSAVCPVSVLDMVYSDYKEFIPKKNNNCTNCGLCGTYCPFSPETLSGLNEKICNSSNPNDYGLKNAGYYTGYDKNTNESIKSASGGITTIVAKEMLDKKIINTVIHAEPVYAKNGQPHYKASVSCSAEEIDKKRSSFYAPICFDKILLNYKNKQENLLLIGTPCVIRGVKNLFTNNPQFNKNNLYTIALICSHNVNGQYTDFLAESLNISKNQEFFANLRNKDNIKDANNFNNHFYDKNGDISKINRFKSIFTKTWRDCFFSMNICFYCPDFWGFEADLSVKDAWGKWSREIQAQSIFIVRNKIFQNIINNSENIIKTELSLEEISNCQLISSKDKQENAIKRLELPIWHFENIKNSSLRKKIFALTSKKLYKYFGFKLSKKILFVFLDCTEIFNDIKNPRKILKKLIAKKLGL